MRNFLGVAGMLLALALPVSASRILSVRGANFVDPAGRIVILRGLNLGSDAKLPPFAARASLDPLIPWGVNAIRLVFTWEAYEPQPGAYNEDYLAGITRLIDDAWSRGVYVVVDMHQDAYSRYLGGGCGEGFPSWTVPQADRRASPGDGTCSPMWGLWTFLAPSTHRAFHRFYADDGGARTAFIRAWARLAQQFKSHPGVIGYDLINEPWGDERLELAPLYEDVARAIRQADPTAILFLEPSAPRTSLGVFQSRLPRPSFGNFAYAPHYYDPRVLILGGWRPFYKKRQLRAFRQLVDKAGELGAPLFVGEMGDPAPTKNVRLSMEFQQGLFMSAFASFAQWSYTEAWTTVKKDGWNFEDSSVVDENGALRPNLVLLPYARKISGVPVGQRSEAFALDVSWTDAGRGGETELFLPEGWKVASVSAGLRCQVRGYLAVCISKNGAASSVRLEGSMRGPP